MDETYPDVAAIHETYERKIERARSNKRLSDSARAADMARALHTHNEQMAALQKAEDASIKATRESLTKELSGNVGNLSADQQRAVMDAYDRAQNLKDPRTALEQLRTAETLGIETYATAIARHAISHGRMLGPWSEVVAEYASTRPKAAETLEQLKSIPNPGDPVFQLKRAAVYALPVPPELQGLSATQVLQLAESDLADESD
ncbi:hypothetical protein [Spirillospora sp. NBC_01491]|uniref:hypothetical protein n=1 Tax=Spirillospora sp. NBC_01491 TaxID=2976007 RepID=UPI002E347C51|nr:hypothetical protein [Spirillospora sp. NBC_01491]